MSTGLPKRFDPRRLAVQDGGSGGTLTGAVETTLMPRLREALAGEEPATASFSLRAFRDEAKRLAIEGRVNATLACRCQRCLEPVMMPVDAQFALAVLDDEDAMRSLPAELDPLLLERDAEIDLPALLEDELILALPQIPMHENISDCGEAARVIRKIDDEFDDSTQRENPFAALKKLKNGNIDRGK